MIVGYIQTVSSSSKISTVRHICWISSLFSMRISSCQVNATRLSAHLERDLVASIVLMTHVLGKVWLSALDDLHLRMLQTMWKQNMP